MAIDYGYNMGRGRTLGSAQAAANDQSYEDMLAMYQQQLAQMNTQYGEMLRLARQRVPMPAPYSGQREMAEQMRMTTDVPRGQRNVATFLYGY